MKQGKIQHREQRLHISTKVLKKQNLNIQISADYSRGVYMRVAYIIHEVASH